MKCFVRFFVCLFMATLLVVTLASSANAQGPNSAFPKKLEKRAHSFFRMDLDNRKVGDVMLYYEDGAYHVFYLLNGTANREINWEHAVSTDLVNWRSLPPAICLSDDPTGPDGRCIFTGDIVKRDDLYHAFYTSWNPDNPKGREFVSHATSRDLISWEKHPEDRFGPDGIRYRNARNRDFRDPSVVWDDEAKEYVMYLNAQYIPQKDDPPKTRFGYGVFRSKDLKTWSQHRAVVGINRDECPDYFQIGDTYYLHGCRWYGHAKSPDGPWKYAAARRTDRLRAAKRIYDGKRHVWFGGWADGPLATPRELYAGPDGLLYMKPVPEVLAVFDKTVSTLKDKKLSAGETLKVKTPKDYLLDTEVILPEGGVLTVKCRNKEKIFFRLTLNDQVRQVEAPILRPDQRPPPVYRAVLPTVVPTEAIKIQAIVVDHLIEFFINDQYVVSISRGVFDEPDCQLTCDRPMTIRQLAIRTFGGENGTGLILAK